MIPRLSRGGGGRRGGGRLRDRSVSERGHDRRLPRARHGAGRPARRPGRRVLLLRRDGRLLLGVAPGAGGQSRCPTALVVEPAESPVISAGRAGTHHIEGGGVGTGRPCSRGRTSTRCSPSPRRRRLPCRGGPPTRQGALRGRRPAANIAVALELASASAELAHALAEHRRNSGLGHLCRVSESCNDRPRRLADRSHARRASARRKAQAPTSWPSRRAPLTRESGCRDRERLMDGPKLASIARRAMDVPVLSA